MKLIGQVWLAILCAGFGFIALYWLATVIYFLLTSGWWILVLVLVFLIMLIVAMVY